MTHWDLQCLLRNTGAAGLCLKMSKIADGLLCWFSCMCEYLSTLVNSQLLFAYESD
jgi:hypothetical protein